MSINPRFEDMGRIRDQIIATLRNWHRELHSLLHDSGLDGLGRVNHMVTVEFRGDDIVLCRAEGEVYNELGRITRQDGNELDTIASLLTLVGDLPPRQRDVRLLFPGDQVLRTNLRLPAASSRTLRKALQYELPRLSPLDPDQLYFDFAIGTADTHTKKKEIALRIIKRVLVDQAVAVCRAAGLKIAAVGFTNDDRDTDWRHFPVDREAVARHLWQRWGVPVLSGIALVLALILIGAIYARGAGRLEEISNRIETERAQASTVLHLKHEIAAASAGARFLNDRKQQPMLIAVLANVTRILPDGTWLTDFQMKDQTLRIQGYSPNASDLIALIDKSPFFENAQFEAPVIQNQANNTERFDLSFKMRQSKQ